MRTGPRVGAGVAKSQKPVALTSPIGEAGTMADASNSQEWIELEIQGEAKYVRGLFVLGGGNSHTRFRNSPAGQIFAKDDNFHARAGGGVGVVTPELRGFRLMPYFLYNSNFGGSDNSAHTTREYGIDFEWSTKGGEKWTSTWVVGAALITETGKAYADLEAGFGSHEGEFEAEGFMVTFGWHLGVTLSGGD